MFLASRYRTRNSQANVLGFIETVLKVHAFARRFLGGTNQMAVDAFDLCLVFAWRQFEHWAGFI
jgi:hypothetical protein